MVEEEFLEKDRLSMELSRLAAKQKRYVDMRQFVATTELDARTKSLIALTLDAYKEAIATCWKNRGDNPDDTLKLLSLERQLDDVFNNARLRSIAP